MKRSMWFTLLPSYFFRCFFFCCFFVFFFFCRFFFLFFFFRCFILRYFFSRCFLFLFLFLILSNFMLLFFDVCKFLRSFIDLYLDLCFWLLELMCHLCERVQKLIVSVIHVEREKLHVETVVTNLTSADLDLSDFFLVTFQLFDVEDFFLPSAQLFLVQEISDIFVERE